jgi:hypothetical protein
MKAIFNPSDFIKVGLMAFVFIWLANMGLKSAGLTQYQA